MTSGYIEKLADYLAESVRKNDPNASSKAVLRYSLISDINQAITILIVLAAGLIFGDIKGALVAIIAFPLLKYFSGGLHLRSMTICNVVTSVLMISSIYTPINYWYNGLILNVIAITILAFTAPNGIKRSKLDRKYYPGLKVISILIVGSNFVFQSHILSMVFLLQAITTLPILQQTLDKYEL